jgi:hypothetical protein
MSDDDLVEHPSHYTSSSIECVDAIAASMGESQFTGGFLRGQVLKYLWRFELKQNRLQDLEKAAWYLNRMIALEAKEVEGAREDEGICHCGTPMMRLYSLHLYRCPSCAREFNIAGGVEIHHQR